MDEQTYMKERVDDQITWLEGKSAWNQTRYKRIQTLIIVCSVLIPFGTGFLTDERQWLQISIGVAGVLIAVGEGVLGLNKYQENWVQYRTTAETLKREKLYYLTQSGPYLDQSKAFKLFVKHVEQILQKENAQWQEYVTEEDK